MKKKWLGVAAAAAAMTLSTGMTAFAAGWVAETTTYGTQWKYVYDDGTWSSGNWFTDPDTQLIYHLDPDGYRMTNTTVDGYWLNEEGVRQEKTEEQISYEAKEKIRKEGVKNPGQKVAKDKAAAQDAADSKAAVGTTRSGYIAELKVILTRILKDLSTTRTDESVEILSGQNNLSSVCDLRDSNGVIFYEFNLWSSAKTKDNAIDLMYMYDAAPEGERELYNSVYEQSVVAALGENEGKAVTDYVQSQREQGVTNLKREGNTDTGNSYTVKYNNNRIDITVTCSEIVPKTEEEAAAEAATEASSENTETEEKTVTSTTITVGAGKTAAAEETESAEESAAE